METVVKNITDRWSPRALSPSPVESEKLRLLFEAARWAPSSFNAQPWRFSLVTRIQKDLFEDVVSCMSEFNRAWAGKTYALITAVALKNYEHNNKPNAHAWYDLGQSVAFMSIQATAMGLYMHQMGGFDPQRLQEILHIPETMTPVTIIAAGYLGEKSSLPEEMQKLEDRMRERKALSEIVFSGSFD